ncbi:MAG: ATP-binding cassette domain-containing protein [Anaerolineaceae bacterium]|nr:ATP-binding cassette domain-containing protein [Anaerolineaceae bacterium]
MAGLIELSNYSFWAAENETQLLHNINLEIEPGEFVIILGPSGSGKSTLAFCITGIYPNVLGGRAEGVGRVADLDVIETPVPQLATHVGMIFQDPDSQFCNLFVDEEVAFGPENLLVPREEVIRREELTLKQVGLSGFERRFINELSGGQKQRVAIASVLAMGPDVLILDQPTANLDPVGKSEVYNLLYDLNQKQNKTVILIEHQVDELIKYATRIILMDGGKIVANGPPRQVLKDWARRLETEMGLWVPEVARLALLAEDHGYPMSTFPLDAEEAAQAWLELPVSKAESLYISPAAEANPEQESFVNIEHVSYSYPNGFKALQDVSLSIYPGNVVGLMGENGSGKTTLSRHLIGLLKPTSGKIMMNGEDIAEKKVKSIAKDVGYVFQYPEHQFVADTVFDEIAYTPRLEGKKGDELKEIVNKTLIQVGLFGLDGRHPLTLSMGEKRRLSIATMLVRNPKLLILDEPTAGLDFRNTQRMIDLLMNLRAQNTIIMLVTHTTQLVASFVDHVFVMEKGELVFSGTPQGLFTNLSHVNTKAIEQPEMLKIVNQINLRQEQKMLPFLTVEKLQTALDNQKENV